MTATNARAAQLYQKDEMDDRLWIYLWAFCIMCYVYAGCKIAGLEWAANRPWSEVIFFLFVATAVITLFFCRKKIKAWYMKMKNNRNR